MGAPLAAIKQLPGQTNMETISETDTETPKTEFLFRTGKWGPTPQLQLQLITTGAAKESET